MPKLARVTLESLAPYSQSSFLTEETLQSIAKDETKEDFERRIFRKRLHINTDGDVFIPPMALKYAMDGACKLLGDEMKKPDNKSEKYTKHFEQAVFLQDGPVVGQPDDFYADWIWADPRGKKGKQSTTRVRRCYPTIAEWGCLAEYYILDDCITESIFRKVINASGMLVGIGRFRPERQGYYGRYRIQKLEITKI